MLAEVTCARQIIFHIAEPRSRDRETALETRPSEAKPALRNRPRHTPETEESSSANSVTISLGNAFGEIRHRDRIVIRYPMEQASMLSLVTDRSGARTGKSV